MAMTGARAAAVARPDAAASPATSRAGWMDNLRVAVIAGVIILHAATAYILDVDWYYQERTTSTLTPLLLVFPALLGGLFGLGPLFLLGGLLAAASLAHKGPGGFARGRLVRLGLPLLAFFVLLDPLTGYLVALAESDHPRLWPYLADQTGTRDTGPLWFVAVLLALSLAYAGLRRLRPARVGVTAGVGPRQLAAVAAVIAAGSFMMRLVSPLATDTYANLTWAAWPQATGLFTLGVLAGERDGWRALIVAGCGAWGGWRSPACWRWPCWPRRPSRPIVAMPLPVAGPGRRRPWPYWRGWSPSGCRCGWWPGSGAAGIVGERSSAGSAGDPMPPMCCTHRCWCWPRWPPDRCRWPRRASSSWSPPSVWRPRSPSGPH